MCCVKVVVLDRCSAGIGDTSLNVCVCCAAETGLIKLCQVLNFDSQEHPTSASCVGCLVRGYVGSVGMHVKQVLVLVLMCLCICIDCIHNVYIIMLPAC